MTVTVFTMYGCLKEKGNANIIQLCFQIFNCKFMDSEVYLSHFLPGSFLQNVVIYWAEDVTCLIRYPFDLTFIIHLLYFLLELCVLAFANYESDWGH